MISNPIYGKIKTGNQTTNQKIIATASGRYRNLDVTTDDQTT